VARLALSYERRDFRIPTKNAPPPAQLVAERLRDATIAIINKVPMPAETLAQLPKLRLIAVAATGTDIVDKDYCRVRGITVVQHSRLRLQHGA
jgi:lactate dehydrogenase-like 2-hydroxyacid dehydrogenase